jgi:hypothetical protein
LEVDHAVSAVIGDRSAIAVFEKDTRSHSGYDADTEVLRLCRLRSRLTSRFDHVVVVRLNPSDASVTGGGERVPCKTCLIARQWMLWGVTMAARDFTVVYVNYSENSPHPPKAIERFPGAVVCTRGTPTDPRQSTFALSTAEMKLLSDVQGCVIP